MYRSLLYILSFVALHNCLLAQSEDFYLIEEKVDTIKMSENDKKVLLSGLNRYHQSSSKIEQIEILLDLLDQFFDERYWVAYSDKAYELTKNAIENSKNEENSLKLKSLLGRSILNIGYYSDFIGHFSESRKHYQKALKIFKELKVEDQISNCINNIGNTYADEGDIDSALYYYLEALNWKKDSPEAYGVNYSNIGYAYDLKGDIIKAHEYYEKARKLQEGKPEFRADLSSTYINLATVLAAMGDTVKCLQYYDKAIAINTALGDDVYLAMNYLNKSIVLRSSQLFEEAKRLNLKAIQMNREMGTYLSLGEAILEYAELKKSVNQMDSSHFFTNQVLDNKAYYEYPGIMSDALILKAQLFVEDEKYSKALKYGEKAYEQAQKSNDQENVKMVHGVLHKVYRKLGNTGKSLFHFEKYIELTNKTQNFANQQKILSHEYKKKLQLQKEKDSLNTSLIKEKTNNQIIAKDLEITRSRNQIYYLSGAGLFALVVIFLLYRNNRQKQRDKEVIFLQKEEIAKERDKAHDNYQIAESNRLQLEERNKEILDSIKYAKRLQEAVLPPQKLVKEWLTNSFILYKPKEIVSGDFYWMETTSLKVDGKQSSITFFAAADCTGHGVPGAMVSVICAGALNRAVNEYQLSDVGEILNKVTELVVASFEKSDRKVNDGMDIALCGLDIGRKIVYFTGANNPLWIITPKEKLKTQSEFKTYTLEHINNRYLHEIKGTKQHIGLNENEKSFQTNKVELQPGDGIFVFSDGLADQFGGNRGKKFKYQQFREILLENFEKDMEAQKSIIDARFESWRGELEQVDDICVIGVKINGKERNNFTKRELEVLEYLVEGLPSKLIADKMHISVHTVDTYRRRLLAKTNTFNTTELINYCKEKEII